jgi:predicted transcriptional regulator
MSIPTIDIAHNGLYGSTKKQAKTELRILDALAETLEGFTWTKLREKAVVSKAVMSESVKRLKESGFIEQREQQYVITRQGEERRYVLRDHLEDSIPSTSAMIIFNSSAEEVSFVGSAQLGRAELGNQSQLEVEAERKKLEADLKNYSKHISSSLTKGVPGFEMATIILSIKKEKKVKG